VSCSRTQQPTYRLIHTNPLLVNVKQGNWQSMSVNTNFYVFWSDSTRESYQGLPTRWLRGGQENVLITRSKPVHWFPILLSVFFMLNVKQLRKLYSFLVGLSTKRNRTKVTQLLNTFPAGNIVPPCRLPNGHS